jgi:hypothetical protein
MRIKVFLTDACLSEKEAAAIVFYLLPGDLKSIARQVITVFGVLNK